MRVMTSPTRPHLKIGRSGFLDGQTVWVCTICTKKIRWSGGGRRGRARELQDNDNDELDRQSQQAKAEAIMKLAVEALADPSPSTGHCTDNYGLHNSTIFIKRIMLIFYRYC